ncbi:MAG: hypothetical protein DMF20_06275 [Verrucomicrobia bacterium]|nr:MAG: hypothetical protein DMF20_06275 [Verrucomicrobiota bacterium]
MAVRLNGHFLVHWSRPSGLGDCSVFAFNWLNLYGPSVWRAVWMSAANVVGCALSSSQTRLWLKCYDKGLPTWAFQVGSLPGIALDQSGGSKIRRKTLRFFGTWNCQFRSSGV